MLHAITNTATNPNLTQYILSDVVAVVLLVVMVLHFVRRSH